jgi:hypothetical protein
VKKPVVSAAVLAAVLANTSALEAQNRPRLLTPAESRIYHACLKAAWIDDYCRSRSFGFLASSYDACLVANGIEIVPVRGYGIGARDRCWRLALSGVP